MDHPALAPAYLHGVYIPTALLLFGTYIVKQEWLPYSLALALILGGYKFYDSSMLFHNHTCFSKTV
jgi:cytochrome-b5 reductase